MYYSCCVSSLYSDSGSLCSLCCMPLKTHYCGRLYCTHVGLKQALPVVPAKQQIKITLADLSRCVADLRERERLQCLMMHLVWTCQPSLVQISFMVDQLFLPSLDLSQVVQRSNHKTGHCRRNSWRVKLPLKVGGHACNKGQVSTV